MDAIASLHPTPEVDLTIFTDASDEGWGASTSDQTMNGSWCSCRRISDNTKMIVIHVQPLKIYL